MSTKYEIVHVEGASHPRFIEIDGEVLNLNEVCDRLNAQADKIAELKDTNSHLLKDHRKWYAEELDEHKAEIVEPLHERIAELKRYISDDVLGYMTRAGERLDQEKARVVELTERVAELEAALADARSTDSDEVKRRHWDELLDAIGDGCTTLNIDFSPKCKWADRWYGEGESESHGTGTDYESLYRYLELTDKEAS